MTDRPTAAVLLIGDELLSGRTRDINLQQIATYLAPFGIPVCESRTVADVQAYIVEAVNALRGRYTYVFTTGGIGPTHDDITADAIAAAFEVGISENPQAMKILQDRYRDSDLELTPARRRMGRIPNGASLILNPVSGAPGFQIGNVFTLAGVPSIARGMLEDVGHRLTRGAIVHRVTVRGRGLKEGDVAEQLADIAREEPDVAFGSYPWFASASDNGVHLVASTIRQELLRAVTSRLVDLVESKGVTAEVLKGDDTR